MARKKKPAPMQITEGAWYLLPFGKPPFEEECCDCGLTHSTDLKLHNGQIWIRYRVNRKATRAARARRKREGERLVVLVKPEGPS